MAVSVRLNEQLFKSYAKTNNISLSELFRRAVFEKLKTSVTLLYIVSLWKNITKIQRAIPMQKYVKCWGLNALRFTISRKDDKTIEHKS